jgi:hypothetical protein
MQVTIPEWWIYASGIYFIVSFVWSVVLCIGVFILYRKVMPLITETQTQVRRVSSQAKSIAAKASSTADIVHAQTQRLLGSAETASSRVTRQARTVGMGLTTLLVAARIVSFFRKVL